MFIFLPVIEVWERTCTTSLYIFSKSMHSQHFLMRSHFFPLLLILTMCVMRFTLYKTYFMLIFAILIAILSGNKVNKCSECSCGLFAVPLTCSLPMRSTGLDRVNERKRGRRRSPGESLWIWELLANLSTLPPNWQVLSRDELRPECSLFDMQHRQATGREARPKHNSKNITSPQAHVHPSIL